MDVELASRYLLVEDCAVLSTTTLIAGLRSAVPTILSAAHGEGGVWGKDGRVAG
jgi:hypothetical protein